MITKTYISIDLETTGLNPKTDKITEIGAVKIEEGVITDTFSTFVNPGRSLEQRIVELTGIRDEDLVGAPNMEDVLPNLLEFMGDLPILGHSILFDYSFLKKACVNQKYSFEKQGIDTLKIARKYLDSLEHRNLEYLCAYYQIPHKAHRALEDARATHFLYEKLVENFYTEEEKLFTPTQLLFHVKKDSPATPAQKEQLYRLLQQHKIEIAVDIDRLTKSEASRMVDRIKSGQLVPANVAE